MQSTKWYAMYVEYKITRVYHFAKIACTSHDDIDDEAYKSVYANVAKYTWMAASRKHPEISRKV